MVGLKDITRNEERIGFDKGNMNYMVYQGLGLKGRLHTNGQGGCGLYGVLFAGFDHYH